MPMAYTRLKHPFMERLAKQVLFTAGPIGSSLLALRPGPDYGDRDGCNEYLPVSDPEAVARIQRSFYAAGCDAVDSATFGANEIVFEEYDLVPRVRELNRLAAQQLNAVRDEFSTPDWPRYSFASVGPGTKLPSLGHTDWETLYHSYFEQVSGLVEGGIDVVKIETCQDLLQTKAALAATAAVFEKTGTRLPVIASVTIETTGTMLLGTDIAAALTVLDTIDVVDIIGINCATGPQEMVEHVRYLAEHSRRPVFVAPNAGLPELVDGEARYGLTPEEFARYQGIFVGEFGTNIAGGCCGTTPAHFEAAIAAIGRRAPKAREGAYEPAAASLYSTVPFEQDTSFLVIGERLNATGSRKFRDLVLAEDIEGMIGLAKEQAAEGAHVLDVMVDYVGRDGVPDMQRLVRDLRTQSTLPLVFDSTEPPVIEAALNLYGGKAIVNSINLEDGENKISRVLPLIRTHGAAAIALVIDEEGQARDVAWKLRVARRIYEIAVDRYGMEPGDLLFDMLTFPLSSGQEELRKDAMATIEAIRLLKEEFPLVHTVLGVSNVSFGLKPAARRVLNSVFLHEAVEAGLDAAIVNARQILPLNRIPDDQLNTALDLIHDRRREGYDPLTAFIGLFEGEQASQADVAEERAKLPLEERLKQRIIDGDRRGLDKDLDEALDRYDPLTIINEHLLDGMKVVGELFGSGKMQLPFVLQSAETMKASVAHLEPHMERADGSTKGKVVLATVRGDVHDIGKNLVDIILTNNGYTVYNIGIKQPIQNIIDMATEVEADAIGLSGLLVKSTVVMREDLEELNQRELFHFPVLLGGAALTRKYVEQDLREIYKGSVYYCQDAFEGLATMDKLMAGEEIPARTTARPPEAGGSDSGKAATPAVPRTDEYVRSDVKRDGPIPEPPFWGSRVVKGLPLREVFPFVNETALFRGQWQYQRGQRSPAEYEAFVESEVRPVFRRMQEEAVAKGLLVPQVLYGYYKCQADRNDLLVWPEVGTGGNPAGEPVRFRFPRQSTGRRLCIADFFRDKESGEFDVVAFTLVTVGPKATGYAKELFDAGEYKDYLHFHGFAVETAEALAESWHKRVREELGIAGRDGATKKELFQQGYRGSRYSFGYPACPDLGEQVGIAALLQPERIGVELSETFQWHPEQTTSAIVVHHEEARYFVVK